MALLLQPAPLRTPVFDKNGMTWQWQRYFMQLFAVSANVTTSVVTITDSVTDLASSSLLDSRNPQDAGAIAEEAAAGVPSDTPRDFGPLVEEALMQSAAPSVKDFSPEIEAAVRAVVESVPQVTRADLDELNSRLVMIESVNRGSAANASTTDFDAVGAAEEISRQQAQPLFKDYGPEIEAASRLVLMDAQTPRVVPADLDEMRALIASLDTPRGSNWDTWTPTITAAATMTVASVTVFTAMFLVLGPLCFIQMQCGFTLGGTANNTVYYTLPIAPTPGVNGGWTMFLNGQWFDAATWRNAFAYANGSPSATQGVINPIPNNTSFTLQANTQIGICGFYRIA